MTSLNFLPCHFDSNTLQGATIRDAIHAELWYAFHGVRLDIVERVDEAINGAKYALENLYFEIQDLSSLYDPFGEWWHGLTREEQASVADFYGVEAEELAVSERVEDHAAILAHEDFLRLCDMIRNSGRTVEWYRLTPTEAYDQMLSIAYGLHCENATA